MAKLTKRQAELLQSMAGGARLAHSTLTGSTWSSDGQFTFKINPNTFNALALRNLIEASGFERATTFYGITATGRAALQDRT